MSTPTETKPEETSEPADAGTTTVHQEPDEHGWVHIGHDHPKKSGPVMTPDCGNPCYQVVKP